MTKELLKIGELARRAGKSVRAIRFYEELGLIHSADHTKGGFRLFTTEEERRIRLIDAFHELGFSLEEIARIVKAYESSHTGDEAHKKLHPMLLKTLETISKKMALLAQLRGEVVNSMKFVDGCSECHDRPGNQLCRSCSKGEHQKGPMPSFIDQIL